MLPFCEHCNDVVDYEELDVQKEKTIKGYQICYRGKEAYCEVCGSPLFVPEIHDYNLSQMNDAYRKAAGLISAEEIRKIPRIYNIGKRPLSKVLGWGEGTLTRYMEGDIPSKQYSQTLKDILDNPSFLKELLENNKEVISSTAYKKCKEAIERITNTDKTAMEIPLQHTKIDDVVQYLQMRCVEITPLALQKLLYYSQGFNKALNGQYLFEDDCEAWIHGPVYRTIYDKYKGYGYQPLEKDFHDADFAFLLDEEKELLDNIAQNLGCYSGKVLEEMTHYETPWRQERKELEDDIPSNHVIAKEAIESYFTTVKNKYNMVTIIDIKDYSKDMFQKIRF